MRAQHIFYENFVGYRCHSRLFDLSGSHKGGSFIQFLKVGNLCKLRSEIA